MDNLSLKKMANAVRRDIVTEVYSAQAGHPGGSLSAADIFTFLYFEEMRIDPRNPKDPDRDRFVLSKGHTCPGLYAAMHGPQSAVESKEVGRRSLCLCKGSQRGGGVPVDAHLQAESVFLWYALCVDNDESARIVGRIFGGRCFHDGQIVNLAAWNHVEGERPRIGLGAWHGASVNPDIVVAL
mgnify:CR=1 FL=1